MIEEKTPSETQRRAVELSRLNSEWLQWYVEDTLSQMPSTLAATVRYLMRKKLELKPDEYWKIVPIMIIGMDPQQFDSICNFFREFLSEPGT